MLTPQFVLPLATKLVVDLFAGGGGTSTGLEWALGRPVDIAVNHDPLAVAMHRANHPQTRHFTCDVFEVDPIAVTDGQPVGLLWASPDCTFHSKARGGKPFRDPTGANKRRGLARVVVHWAKAVQPDLILMENVEEFQDWGPLAEDGRPCQVRKGLNFRRWVAQLKNLGYAVEWRELRACDYGAPTIRKRLFVIARRDGLPIVWPAPTHAKEPAKGSGLKPWRTAAECIDWSIPCPSIFERERPLADATLRRIAHGVMRYVVNAAKPFIVPVTHHGDNRVHGIDEPVRTVTTAKRGELALVAPAFATIGYGERAGQAPRAHDPLQPLGTIVGAKKHALVSAFLAKHYGGVVGHELTKPAGAVTSRDSQGLVTSNLVKLRGTSTSASTTAPLGTISAQGMHHAEVRAFLIRYFGTDQDPKLCEPLATSTTKARDAVVTVEIGGEPYALVDIGMRMLQPRELFRAQGFRDTYIIDWGLNEYGRRIELTKEEQVRMCGNSVSPVMSEALCLANYDEAIERRRAA